MSVNRQMRVEPNGIFIGARVWDRLAVDIEKQPGDAQRMFRMDSIANPRPFARHFTPSMTIIEDMIGDVPYRVLADGDTDD